jgi:Uma2 family endonuclease
VAELWLVDIRDQTVTAHRRSAPGGQVFDVTIVANARDTLTSPLLPEFGVGVGELFVP